MKNVKISTTLDDTLDDEFGSYLFPFVDPELEKRYSREKIFILGKIRELKKLGDGFFYALSDDTKKYIESREDWKETYNVGGRVPWQLDVFQRHFDYIPSKVEKELENGGLIDLEKECIAVHRVYEGCTDINYRKEFYRYGGKIGFAVRWEEIEPKVKNEEDRQQQGEHNEQRISNAVGKTPRRVHRRHTKRLLKVVEGQL